MRKNGNSKIRLTPITRLMMTLDIEMSLDKGQAVFSDERRLKYQVMHAEALRRRENLLRSLVFLDAASMLLLYGKSVTIPGLGVNLLDIPAGLEVATVLAALAFMFLALAFFNEQAYQAIVNKFGERHARPSAIDPDFVNAGENFFEFYLKLYRGKMNIWGEDFYRPGLPYRVFFGALTWALMLALFGVFLLHLLASGAVAASLWSQPSDFYISQAVAAFGVSVNIIGICVFMSMNWAFQFSIVDPPTSASAAAPPNLILGSEAELVSHGKDDEGRDGG